MKKYFLANPVSGCVVICILALSIPIWGVWKGDEHSRLFHQWQEKHPNLQLDTSESAFEAYNRTAFFLKAADKDVSLAIPGLKSVLSSVSVSDEIRGLARYNLSQIEQRQADVLHVPQEQVEQLKLAIAGYRDVSLWLQKGDVYQDSQTALAQALMKLPLLQQKVSMQEYERLQGLGPDKLVDELEQLSRSKIGAIEKGKKRQLILSLIQQKTANYPFYVAPPN